MAYDENLLTIRDLHTYFYTEDGIVKALNGVNLDIKRGEVLGLVGESGSGKSVTALSILRLIQDPPGKIVQGEIWFEGENLLQLSTERMCEEVRGGKIAMIFQDPMTSLNPYLRIEDQLIEPLLIHERMNRAEAVQRGIRALEEVGVPAAARRIRSYPHEFSGGMRQRVMIAMALITRPELLIADEPTTALDVTVQAQILELVGRMQRELGMAVIWITHDLGVVAGFCRRVLVMYGGRIVESAGTDALYSRPRHPYTKALQQSIPALQTRGAELYTIPGAPPDLSQDIRGCPFVPRCTFAREECNEPVQLKEAEPGHATACLRVQKGEIQL
jgi:oligopeptide transport system ATP-binding protein